MHPQDQELFSAMLTIELSKKINRWNPRFETEAAKLTTQAMSRLVKSGSIKKRTFRYYQQITQPAASGFQGRWSLFFNRYFEIHSVAGALAGKSEIERLTLCFAHLTERYGMHTQTGIQDTEHFDSDVGQVVANKGFVGLAKSELQTAIDESGSIRELLMLSCFLPDRERIINVMRSLQTFNFLLYEPETTVEPNKVGFICLIGHQAYLKAPKALEAQLAPREQEVA